MKKILAVTLAILSILIGLTGCGMEEKTYSKSGMSITLPGYFYEKELMTYTYYLESIDSIVLVIKETFDYLENNSEFNSNSSLTEYANAVITNNKLDSEVERRQDGKYEFFNFEKTVDGKDFFYLATVYKSQDSFWLIQFACLTKDKDTFMPQFLEWADTVTFE